MEIFFTTTATAAFQLGLCLIGFLQKTGPIQSLGDIMNASTNDKIESTKPNMNML